MNLIEARVVLQERGLYRIRTDSGEQSALVSGKFQYDALSASDYPVVGDFVLADCADPDTAVIHRVLPRKSLFVRRAAGTGQAEQAVADVRQSATESFDRVKTEGQHRVADVQEDTKRAAGNVRDTAQDN